MNKKLFIIKKLRQLKAEKESLLKYKQSLLENKFDNNVKKQIKNIDDRLQAIEYTENCLNTYRNEILKEAKIVFLSMLGIIAASAVFWIWVNL